jgi:hypothetical protein
MKDIAETLGENKVRVLAATDLSAATAEATKQAMAKHFASIKRK